MIKIAVVGIGSIGSLCTAWLTQRQDVDLTLVSRSSYSEISLETPSRSFHVQTYIFTPDQIQKGPQKTMDWVIISTKHHQTKNIGAILTKLCDHQTKIAILQNSVEHLKLITPLVPTKHLLPVLIRCSVIKPSPTFLIQTSSALFTTPDTVLGQEFASLLSHSDIQVHSDQDFLTRAWEKLCMSANHSIHVLLNQPAGIIHKADIEYLFKTVMQEVVTVARLEGARLSYSDINRLVDNLKSEPEDSSNPMLEDYQQGNTMEIEAQNGVVVRLARQHGIKVPYNQMIYTLLNNLSVQQNRQPYKVELIGQH